MSEEAKAVLEKMRAGCVLVGFENDYGRPFRLLAGNTREDISRQIAEEILNSYSIRAEPGEDVQTEYRSI